jgi:S-adenosyl-L-methionine hydrolase (adenosine-forming)
LLPVLAITILRRMIVLFTDFGLAGPYTGQVKAVLQREAPGVAVIDLFADAPRMPQPAAYLLAAYGAWFPPGTVFLAVVDPGVGSARAPLAVIVDGRWYVGPDNGLFELVMRRAQHVMVFEIAWRPRTLSASFHGRDLFAPAAAWLAHRAPMPAELLQRAAASRHEDWPDDLPQIVYIDVYGNAITGLRANRLPESARLGTAAGAVARARTFSDVPVGAAFWYENSNGLAEIAVNQGRADRVLGLTLGAPVTVLAPAAA